MLLSRRRTGRGPCSTAHFAEHGSTRIQVRLDARHQSAKASANSGMPGAAIIACTAPEAVTGRTVRSPVDIFVSTMNASGSLFGPIRRAGIVHCVAYPALAAAAQST